MAINNSYRQYETVVDATGVLPVENLGGSNSKIIITNITNAVKTPGSSDSLLVQISAYPTSGISFKKVKAAAGITETVGDLASNGVVYANQSLSAYPLISQATVAVATQAITVTLPASASLPVGGFVMLSNFNDGAKALRTFQSEPLAILKKSGNDYTLGTIVPTGVTVTGGKADVTFIGMTLPTQAAHPFLVKSRAGSIVTITASISESYYHIAKAATDISKYCFVLSSNSVVSRSKSAERFCLEVLAISNDGTGTITVNDPDRIINDAYTVLATDNLRFVLEGQLLKKVGLDSNRVYFTGLTAGDAYMVESEQ
ncbi:MAG: hypothetical protein ACRCX2_22315 [Paraclostridium sp.]